MPKQEPQSGSLCQLHVLMSCKAAPKMELWSCLRRPLATKHEAYNAKIPLLTSGHLNRLPALPVAAARAYLKFKEDVADFVPESTRADQNSGNFGTSAGEGSPYEHPSS